ncbi:DUF4192 domain-containing protein [Plantactinospora sp. GCM10030261]|uniref:DUF4192 domain-containing protein n=1 Tax=Plantactinospora sp. GCM10030261 TaxID=3273420 RepID=UPI003615650B
MASSDPPRLTVRSPADLLAAVPYLLGFHPTDSLVVVAMHRDRISFAARIDLPESDPPRVRAATDGLAVVVARQRVDAVTLVGYGPPARVTAAVDAAAGAISKRGLPVIDQLRVTAGRWWSYLCTEPDCCPIDGHRLDPSTSPVSAAAVFAGQVALPDRAALERQVAPAAGSERAMLREATERAANRLATLRAGGPAAESAGPVGGGRAGGPGCLADDRRAEPGPVERKVLDAGCAAIREAVHRHRSGGRLTDDEVTWLGLLVNHLPVGDEAWTLIEAGDDDQIDLWTDVVRRVDPALVPAPASLLALAAWLDGHGALAAVALDRALEADPGYPLALLLDDALSRGMPPAALRDWPDRAGGGPGAFGEGASGDGSGGSTGGRGPSGGGPGARGRRARHTPGRRARRRGRDGSAERNR